VIPFLNNSDNVLMLGNAVFFHDKALCMRTKATQLLLKESRIEFWGNDIWPGTDLNPAENIGTIIKNEFEIKMLKKTGKDGSSYETFRKNLILVLESLEHRTELFENLLCSYPSRFKAVRDAQHTGY
jgi:hypothetical protein